MNVQRIERLKGLLSTIERNAKKPRVAPLSDVMVSVATPPIMPMDHISLVSVVEAPIPSAVAVSESDLLPPSAPVTELVVAKTAEPDLEDLDLDEVAVELPSVPPGVAPAIEDVTAAEVSLEEAEPKVEALPLRTEVHAAKAPYTAPPDLEELSFSEPPPPVTARPSEASASSLEEELMAIPAVPAEEPEAPLLTPPPASGRQPARPASLTPASLRPEAPTMEQLGEIVELEEGSGPELELAEPMPLVARREPEELEFVPAAAGPAPREAMPTLEEEEPLPSEPPGLEVTFEEEATTSVRAQALTAQVVTRPAVVPTRPVIDVITQANAYAPSSFLELLDASLRLGKSSGA